MPKGPQGQKRPVSTISNAVHIAKIATGEIEESKPKIPKKKRDQSVGKKTENNTTNKE